MVHPLIQSLGWLAATFGAVAFFGQHRRSVRNGLEGVSLSTWLLFCLNGGLWALYGVFFAHSSEVVIGSLICLPFQFAIVVRLAPWKNYCATVAATGVFFGCCVLPGVIGGWSASAYGAGVAMMLLRVPQLFVLMRVGRAIGVSSTSWFLVAGSTGLWVLYYGSLNLWAPMVAFAGSGIMSTIIGMLAARRHHSHNNWKVSHFGGAFDWGASHALEG